MSREIKFRLYSKGAERYIDYYSVGFSSSGGVKNMSNKNGVGPIFPEDYIVEQYTGLKDKNGKEIYEGDIVDDGFSRHCEIKWSKHFTAFEAKDENDGHETNIWFISKYGEVIGNIHDNPELVGGEE